DGPHLDKVGIQMLFGDAVADHDDDVAFFEKEVGGDGRRTAEKRHDNDAHAHDERHEIELLQGEMGTGDPAFLNNVQPRGAAKCYSVLTSFVPASRILKPRGF